MEQESKLNCTGITFPSDRLSIADLRRLFPSQFDLFFPDYAQFFAVVGPTSTDRKEFDQLGIMLYDERHLARLNIEDALSTAEGWTFDVQEQLERNEERKTLIASLESAYQAFKLAPGPEAARMLIRELQEKAAASVEQPKGPSR